MSRHYNTSGSLSKINYLLEGMVKDMGYDPERAYPFTILATPDPITDMSRPRILISIEFPPKENSI